MDGIDHLTLQTGQKLKVPFRQMLVISTNLDPQTVMTPGLQRRLGYKAYLGAPSPEQYAEIFKGAATRFGLTISPQLIEQLIKRHKAEGRPLRGCEPNDLVQRCRDISRYRDQELALNEQILDIAWKGYFGTDPNKARE